jgi:hypothetical protein
MSMAFAQYLLSHNIRTIHMVAHYGCEISVTKRPDAFMRKAEMKGPTRSLLLSQAFASFQGVYYAIQYRGMFPAVWPQLFTRIYGQSEDFATDYHWSLMEHEILRKEAQQFGREIEV